VSVADRGPSVVDHGAPDRAPRVRAMRTSTGASPVNRTAKARRVAAWTVRHPVPVRRPTAVGEGRHDATPNCWARDSGRCEPARPGIGQAALIRRRGPTNVGPEPVGSRSVQAQRRHPIDEDAVPVGTGSRRPPARQRRRCPVRRGSARPGRRDESLMITACCVAAIRSADRRSQSAGRKLPSGGGELVSLCQPDGDSSTAARKFEWASPLRRVKPSGARAGP
jgi:hypothetical protein